MEWQQLLGFYKVAKLGSFTKAAEATFRTQSALTQQIKALEEEWHCQLFERIGKRKVSLTPAGEKLLMFAEEVLARYERLKEELFELQGLTKGPLKLAAPFTTLYHLLPEPLKTFVRQFPQVELTVLDRPQREVIALVKSAEVDLGLILESLVPKNLEHQRWMKVHTALMVPPDHPLCGLKGLEARQIARYPLILPPKSLEYSGRERLEELFRKEGLDFHLIMESSNVELSAMYVEMGLGIAFATVTEDSRPLNGRNLAFLPLDHYFAPDHIAVILRKDRTLTSYKRAFVNLVLGRKVV